MPFAEICEKLGRTDQACRLAIFHRKEKQRRNAKAVAALPLFIPPKNPVGPSRQALPPLKTPIDGQTAAAASNLLALFRESAALPVDDDDEPSAGPIEPRLATEKDPVNKVTNALCGDMRSLTVSSLLNAEPGR